MVPIANKLRQYRGSPVLFLTVSWGWMCVDHATVSVVWNTGSVERPLWLWFRSASGNEAFPVRGRERVIQELVQGRNTDIWPVGTTSTRSTSPTLICLCFNFSVLSEFNHISDFILSLSRSLLRLDGMMSWWTMQVNHTVFYLHILTYKQGFMKVNLRPSKENVSDQLNVNIVSKCLVLAML